MIRCDIYIGILNGLPSVGLTFAFVTYILYIYTLMSIVANKVEIYAEMDSGKIALRVGIRGFKMALMAIIYVAYLSLIVCP